MKKFIQGAAAGVAFSGLVFCGIAYFAPSATTSFVSNLPKSDFSESPPEIKIRKEIKPFVGQWVSEKNVIPNMNDNSIVLWITANGVFQFEILESGNKSNTIIGTWKGNLKKLENGNISGNIISPKKDMKPISKFTLSKPEGGRMSLIGNGISISLEYKGL